MTKTICGDELVDAIGRVNEGDAVFSPRLAGFVLDAFARDALGGTAAAADDADLDQLDAARARGAPAHRARLSLQGDRASAWESR